MIRCRFAASLLAFGLLLAGCRDGAWRVARPGWSAEVDGSGLTVKAGDRALRFAPASLTLAGRSVACDAPKGADGEFSRSCGYLRERVIAVPNGLEHAWDVATKPDGDFAVRIALAGSEASLDERGVALRTADGGRFRWGPATFVDAAGARLPVPWAVEDGALVLRVPAEILAGAAFPATLDPVLGPEELFGGAVIEPAGTGRAAAASDGTGFLVVTTALRAVRVDAAGDSLDPAGIVLSTGTASAIDTAWNGSAYLVAWSSYVTRGFTTTFTVQAARITPAGTNLDPVPLLLGSGTGSKEVLQVLAHGPDWLVLWRDATSGISRLRLTRIGATGAADCGVVLPPTGVSAAALAWDGSRMVLAWGSGPQCQPGRVFVAPLAAGFTAFAAAPRSLLETPVPSCRFGGNYNYISEIPQNFQWIVRPDGLDLSWTLQTWQFYVGDSQSAYSQRFERLDPTTLAPATGWSRPLQDAHGGYVSAGSSGYRLADRTASGLLLPTLITSSPSTYPYTNKVDLTLEAVGTGGTSLGTTPVYRLKPGVVGPVTLPAVARAGSKMLVLGAEGGTIVDLDTNAMTPVRNWIPDFPAQSLVGIAAIPGGYALAYLEDTRVVLALKFDAGAVIERVIRPAETNVTFRGVVGGTRTVMAWGFRGRLGFADFYDLSGNLLAQGTFNGSGSLVGRAAFGGGRFAVWADGTPAIAVFDEDGTPLQTLDGPALSVVGCSDLQWDGTYFRMSCTSQVRNTGYNLDVAPATPVVTQTGLGVGNGGGLLCAPNLPCLNLNVPSSVIDGVRVDAAWNSLGPRVPLSVSALGLPGTFDGQRWVFGNFMYGMPAEVRAIGAADGRQQASWPFPDDVTVSPRVTSRGDGIIYAAVTRPMPERNGRTGVVVRRIAPGFETAPVAAETTTGTAVGLALPATDQPSPSWNASTPAHGSAEIVGSSVTYTPDAGFVGVDSFTVTGTSSSGVSGVRTYRVLVKTATATVTMSAATASAASGVALAIPLTSARTPPGPVTYEVNPTEHGGVSISGSTLTYTPDDAFSGTDTLTITALDAACNSTSATVTVTVTMPPRPPVPENATVTTPEDTTVAIPLKATDPNGDVVTYRVLSVPVHGTLRGTPSSMLFVPDPDFNGTDSLTFEAADPGGRAATGKVTIVVTPVNDPPVAKDGDAATDEDVPLDVVFDATDVDGDALTFTIVAPPAHGTYAGGRYVPEAEFSGSDAITFEAADPSGKKATGTVRITVRPVNDAPLARADAISVDEDGSVGLLLAGSDADDVLLTFAVVASPAHGTLSGTPPSLTYAPAPDFAGSDAFTFRVTDPAGLSSTAVVRVTVRPVNDAPVASDTQVTTAEDVAIDLVFRAIDVDDATLTYAVTGAPLHGSVSGTRYTPARDFQGADEVAYEARDAAGARSQATVNIRVTPVNDAPTTADVHANTDEDTPIELVLPGADVDGDALTWTITQLPGHGTLSGTPPPVRYAPGRDFHGSDAFAFQVADPGGLVASGRAEVEIASVNDAPVASEGEATTSEDVAILLDFEANDVDGDALSWQLVTPPAHGTLDGHRYVPAADFHGDDAVTWRVSDPSGATATARTVVHVQPVNDAPQAFAGALATREDTPADLTLRGSDVDGEALVFSIVEGPAHGVLTGTPPEVRFTPEPDWSGSDAFTFAVSDAAGLRTEARVEIAVAAVDDAPVAESQVLALDEDGALDVVLAASDVDDETLEFRLIDAPGHGSLTGTPPALRYVPAANFHGSDAFAFEAADAAGQTSRAQVRLTVSPVNDAPIAKTLEISLDEDTPAEFAPAGFDLDGDALTPEIVAPPEHGSVEIVAGAFRYVPAPDASGDDRFRYRVRDGSAVSEPAEVLLHVAAVNDAPVVTFPAEDEPLEASDAQPFEITLVSADVDGPSTTWRLDRGPEGAVLDAASGVLAFSCAWRGGTHDFEVSVSDGAAATTRAFRVRCTNAGPVDEALRGRVPVPALPTGDSSTPPLPADDGGCAGVPAGLPALVVLLVRRLRRSRPRGA